MPQTINYQIIRLLEKFFKTRHGLGVLFAVADDLDPESRASYELIASYSRHEPNRRTVATSVRSLVELELIERTNDRSEAMFQLTERGRVLHAALVGYDNLTEEEVRQRSS